MQLLQHTGMPGMLRSRQQTLVLGLIAVSLLGITLGVALLACTGAAGPVADGTGASQQQWHTLHTVSHLSDDGARMPPVTAASASTRFGARPFSLPFRTKEQELHATLHGFIKCVVQPSGEQEWRIIMSALRTDTPLEGIDFHNFGLNTAPLPHLALHVPVDLSTNGGSSTPAGRFQPHDVPSGPTQDLPLEGQRNGLIAMRLKLQPEDTKPLYHLKMDGSAFYVALLSSSCVMSQAENAGSQGPSKDGVVGGFPITNYVVYANPPSDDAVFNSTLYVDVLAHAAAHHASLGFNASIAYLHPHQYTALLAHSPRFAGLLESGLVCVVVWDMHPQVHGFLW